MPAVTVTAARNANRCGGAGSGLGCCVVAQVGLGTGRQRHGDGGSAGLVTTALVWLRWRQRRLWKPRAWLWLACGREWMYRARHPQGLSEGWGGEEMR